VVCGLRWTRTAPQWGPCSANAVSASGTRSVTAATHLGAWYAATPTIRDVSRVSPQRSSLSAAAAEATTLPSIAVAVSGRRRWRRLLKSERRRKDCASARLPASKAAPVRISPEQEKQGPGWNHTVRGVV
jgi:hypothetical protein